MRAWLVLLLVAPLVGCTTPPADPPNDTDSGSEGVDNGLKLASIPFDESVVAANNEFALRLLRQLAAENPGENVFLSPLSISIALAMAYQGADGATRTAMAQALGYEGFVDDELAIDTHDLLRRLRANDTGAQVGIANSLWLEDEFAPNVRPSYRDLLTKRFSAEIQTRSFKDPATVDAINAWASQKTAGRIPKVLESIDPDEVAFLLNAIAFEGRWETPFKEDQTRDGEFTRSDGSRVTVPFMTGAASGNMSARQLDGVTVLRLPYGGNHLSMWVLLPAGPVAPFVAGLDDAELAGYLVRSGGGGGFHVVFPKLAITTHYDLVPTLTQLGMGIAFTDSADFTRIAAQPPLVLTRVTHDAMVRVDEKGTVAAAVTTVGVGVTSAPPTITFDRPFLFLIRDDESGQVLFSGTVLDPSAS